MKPRNQKHLSVAVRTALLLAAVPFTVLAQDAAEPTKTLESVQVTGSRIKQTDAVTQSPVAVITRVQIEKSGVTSVGELLQQVTGGGSALNAKFNSSGNFGYPADGGGIGAGSAQVDLRHLGSKRVLVLVDGLRWVNESSASGVSGSADLNTIPLAVIERIEILEDGASAIYGSDAIGGVVNIITRKKYDGASIHAKFGQYDKGGDTTDISMTLGGSGDEFSAVFGASYYKQESISSNAYEQSRFPVPGGGLAYGSSATPQGRFTFCDPARPVGSYGSCSASQEFFYDVTLNNGTVTPNWNSANPSAGSYHDFSGADRFNYSAFNLLLTPSERKSVFMNADYDISENLRIHAKAMYNNRTSTNQAAPEPIFVGPYAGTGGIADTIFISRLNPFNPFGIDLNPASNFGWVTRRPIEVGPRIFNQNVDTWYFNVGLNGAVGKFDWDMNYVHTENSAEQTFYNGYNMGHIAVALGNPATCAATPGCTPLDLFGGQGRPMTAQMIDWIRTTQIDSSEQILDIFSANITGDLFGVGDRSAGFAAGVEHRRYKGEFNPDPLRQTGESQDSFASPVSESYNVSEIYAELNVPFAETFDVSAALRYSDYSNFGGATTGKVGFRWQPIEDLVLRGTYSQGFRAPNIGELFGLTQFGATLVDPCGPTNGALVVEFTDANLNGIDDFIAPNEVACRAQGVPNGFRQANTQITTFTGGNPNLSPEESDSYTLGVVYSPGWAEGLSWSDRLDFELSYYNHKIDGAIQARDVQALLNACLAAGGTNPTLCSPFVRPASGGGNLAPPNNFLDNLGQIETDGFDVKVNWNSPQWSMGRLTASLQASHVLDYKAVDSDGNVAQRTVGIEVSNSAIPDWQTNLQLGWLVDDWSFNWNMRYISGIKEACNGDIAGLSGCVTAASFNNLGATTYHDAQVSWNNAFSADGMKISLGLNNVFAKDPPVCLTCSLNGYDAATYDIPGRFWYISMDYKF
jgi:iron complex outermembrane recepter protein